MLTCYRKDVLPTVVGGWDSLTDDEKAKLSNVNQFFVVVTFLLVLQINQKHAVRFGILILGKSEGKCSTM